MLPECFRRTEWFPGNSPSFNLDFGALSTGSPGTYGAASGQIGTWVDLPLGTTNGLASTSASPTSVDITLTGDLDLFNPQTTTDSILLRDRLTSDPIRFIAFKASLTGLAPGRSDVYYFSFTPTSGLTLNGLPLDDLAGGSADSLGARGTNWEVASGVVISGGTLDIVDTTLGSDGLSGIQIVAVAVDSLVFADGFETGGASGWSAALP